MKHLLMLISAVTLLSVSWMAVAAAVEFQNGVSTGSGDAAKGRIIYLDGNYGFPSCAECHGVEGMGSGSMGTPRLAYQTREYVWRQLEDFAADKRMDHAIFMKNNTPKMFMMNDIVRALTSEQRRDVAAYVYTLEPPVRGSGLDEMHENGDVHQGKLIAEDGVSRRGIPACMGCHTFYDRSADNMYSSVGGLSYYYLRHELEAFRLGASTSSSEDYNARDNDYQGQMRKVAVKMTDEDIANVAAFLSVARPLTAGASSVPDH